MRWYIPAVIVLGVFIEYAHAVNLFVKAAVIRSFRIAAYTYGRLLTPFFIFHKKYFSNPTFIHFAQIAFFM